MRFLPDLLARHGARLDDDTRAAIAESIRRDNAREAFAYPQGLSRLDAQSGFVLFEREFSNTPVHLFGQDVASLAHTRMRLFRARRDEAGDLAPAEEVFSARISEKSLTDAMLLSNRSTGAPITVTRLGDFELPERAPIASKAERSAQSYSGREADDVAAALAELNQVIEGKLTKPSSELKAAVSTVALRVRDIASIKFPLERHLEEMSKLRTEVLTEAAHAALHANRVSEALSAPQRPAIEGPAPLDWDQVAAEHPMVDAMLDPLGYTEREALRTLIVAEIEHLSQEHPRLMDWIVNDEEGRPEVHFPSARDCSIAFNHGDDREAARTQADALERIWNWAFNPYVAESRAQYRPDQAALGVTQRSGWMGHIHSSLPPTDGHYFSLSVQPAYEEEELGATRLRTRHAALIDIEIVGEDLMTALRGHPLGYPMPCSIRGLCGITGVPEERPIHEMSADIEGHQQALEASPEIRELRAALSELNDLAQAKRSGKKWASELEAAVQRIQEAFDAALPRVASEMDSGRNTVDHGVVKSAELILSEIAKALPRDAIELLRLTPPK